MRGQPLTEAQRRDIVRLRALGISRQALAERFRVRPQTITDVLVAAGRAAADRQKAPSNA